MAYNLAYIRNRVLDDKLDDVSFNPEVIDRFINDAQREIFNMFEFPFTEKVFVGSLPGGERIFQFPLDYQMTQALKLVAPDGFRKDITDYYIKFREFNQAYPTPENNTPGAPYAWTTHGNKLYVDRPTDQDYTLELWYIKKPAKLEADTDIPEVPEEFEEALVLGAYYRALGRNEDFDLQAFVQNGSFATQSDLMVTRLGKRQSGKPMAMRQTLRRNRGRGL